MFTFLLLSPACYGGAFILQSRRGRLDVAGKLILSLFIEQLEYIIHMS